MADQTLNPTANQTPDPGQGGLAVTGAINTGHGSTTAARAGVGSQTKTCRWSSFESPTVQPTKLTLKVDWTQNGSLSDGGISTANLFQIEYSLNGGSSWTGLHSAADIESSSSGTSEVVLSPTQNISQVQVRDTLNAVGAVGESASVTASVSGIRIEVEFGANKIILSMM